MGYATNFDETVTLQGSTLHVTGSTDGITHGPDEEPAGQLVSRAITVKQGDQVASGMIAPALNKWAGDIDTGGSTFAFEDCLTTGTEVYTLNEDLNPHAITTTVTVTWTQKLKIEQG